MAKADLNVSLDKITLTAELDLLTTLKQHAKLRHPSCSTPRPSLRISLLHQNTSIVQFLVHLILSTHELDSPVCLFSLPYYKSTSSHPKHLLVHNPSSHRPYALLLVAFTWLLFFQLLLCQTPLPRVQFSIAT